MRRAVDVIDMLHSISATPNAARFTSGLRQATDLWSLRRVARYSPLALVLLAVGCSSSLRSLPLDQPTPVKAHDFVWIWSGVTVYEWQAVVITQDSVSGIQYGMSLKCDSCRRSIPRAQVDSMKLEYKTGDAKSVALTSLVIAGVLAAAILAEYVVATIARAAGVR